MCVAIDNGDVIRCDVTSLATTREHDDEDDDNDDDDDADDKDNNADIDTNSKSYIINRDKVVNAVFSFNDYRSF